MANTVTTQTLVDGDRNLVILLTGLLDTSDEARNVKVDVSAYAPSPVKVRVDKIQYSTSDGLHIVLDWDATTDVRFAVITGQGEIEAKCIGGLTNNAGAGVTGDIYLTTVGWGSGVKGYTLLLHCVKESF